MWVLKSKRYPAASKWLRPERVALDDVRVICLAPVQHAVASGNSLYVW